jgi:hypothetical protein
MGFHPHIRSAASLPFSPPPFSPPTQRPSAPTRGFILAREILPSRRSHTRGCSQLNLLQAPASCSISTQFPSTYRLTGSPQVAEAGAHCRHISYSRHTPRWKTAREPPACAGIGEAYKSTHAMTALDAPTGVGATRAQGRQVRVMK